MDCDHKMTASINVSIFVFLVVWFLKTIYLIRKIHIMKLKKKKYFKKYKMLPMKELKIIAKDLNLKNKSRLKKEKFKRQNKWENLSLNQMTEEILKN